MTRGKPTIADAVAKIKRDANGQPTLHASTWPNTGIGRLNLDGSLGSCSACHSRHDFSPRRARQPENCGKCHLGPDHPQKEIYDESKHGVAFRDLKDHMNLDCNAVGAGRRLCAGADLRDLPHVGQHAQRRQGDARPGRAHLLDQSPAGQPAPGYRTPTAKWSRRPIPRSVRRWSSTLGAPSGSE